MRKPKNLAPACRAKTGFNLIEAAIVLGVVGLVIGGIWIAASAVTENLKINAVTNGVLHVTQRMRAVFNSSHQPASVNIDLSGSDGINMKLYPDNWILGSNIRHDFGGAAAIFMESAASGVGPSFILYLNEIPSAACIKISNAIFNRFTLPGDLQNLGIFDNGASSFFSYGLGVTPLPTVPPQCMSGPETTITFRFSLNTVN